MLHEEIYDFAVKRNAFKFFVVVHGMATANSSIIGMVYVLYVTALYT